MQHASIWMSGFASANLIACVQCPDEDQPPPITVKQSNAGGWFLLALVVAVVVFDLIMLKRKQPTASQWFRRWLHKFKWWKAIAVLIFAGTLWHLIFGGPL